MFTTYLVGHESIRVVEQLQSNTTKFLLLQRQTESKQMRFST